MKSLLLAAGLGTRLRPITLDTPKCLVEIEGRPVISYWLEALATAKVTEVFINTHWLPEKVTNYVQQSKWRDMVYFLHETELLGTAGTIKSNLKRFMGDDLLVAHADNLIAFNLLSKIKEHHARPENTVMTMLCFECEDPTKCGIVTRDDNNVMIDFFEKSPTKKNGNTANAAVYIMSEQCLLFLESLDESTTDFSTEVIPQLTGKVFTVDINGYLRDIGTVNDLELARQEFGTIARRHK